MAKNQKSASVDVNTKLQALLASIEEQETEGEGEGEETSDPVTDGVMAALAKLGLDETKLESLMAKKGYLKAGEEEGEEEEEESGDIGGDELQAKIEKGVLDVLKALDIEVEDDEGEEEEGEEEEEEEGEESEMDAELDTLSSCVAAFLNKYDGKAEAAMKLTARLTAATNLSVLAVSDNLSAKRK